MVRLAIVGSRNFKDYILFKAQMNKHLRSFGVKVEDIEEVVSGGALGTDSLAQRWAKDNELPMTIYYPRWGEYGKSAGPMRNTQIVERCTHMVAFPSHKGSGTQDSMGKAHNKGRRLAVCWYEEITKVTKVSKANLEEEES